VPASPDLITYWLRYGEEFVASIRLPPGKSDEHVKSEVLRSPIVFCNLPHENPSERRSKIANAEVRIYEDGPSGQLLSATGWKGMDPPAPRPVKRPAPELALWFVRADDADGNNNDLLVWAAGEDEVLRHWREYFYPDDEPDTSPEWIKPIPLARRPGPISWDEIHGEDAELEATASDGPRS